MSSIISFHPDNSFHTMSMIPRSCGCIKANKFRRGVHENLSMDDHDAIFGFPVEDGNGVLFQVGDDLKIFDWEIEKKMVEGAGVFDVVDWEYISNFGDGEKKNPLLGSTEEGEENHGSFECLWTVGEDQGSMMKLRRDRSKTIVSERKRRGRMKEKLYELRSLVPNITKMDKASIVADAIVYVQNLQRQEKNLAEEIAILENSSSKKSLSSDLNLNDEVMTQRKKQKRCKYDRGMILGVWAHQVGGKQFHVKIECNREDGATSSLYHAMETLLCFGLESSVIARASDRYVCTLMFNCGGMKEEMNALTMKYWVMDALLMEGFPFMTTAIY